MTANIDHGRRSLSVTRSLMPAILAAHAGDRSVPGNAIAALRSGGLMGTERLDPLVTTLVEVMTNPTLVITVEIAGGQRPRLATIWGTPRRAVVGMTDDRRRFDLLQIEPNMLPFHLAQATALIPKPRPPFKGGCSMPVAELSAAEELAATDPSGAERRLADSGVPVLWAKRILGALTRRRSLWTMESVWLGSNTRRNQSRLSVLDAGQAGYWRLVGDDDQHRVMVTVTDFDEVMRRFAELLPGSVGI